MNTTEDAAAVSDPAPDGPPAASPPAGAAPEASAETPSDIPPHRYTAELADVIEVTWQDRWEHEGTFHAPNPTGELAEGFDRVAIRPHAYIMDMFPYPSGAGLHVGHPLGYIGTDVYARYLRMRGDNVLHTMGYDAFGLPAEQYAVQTGQHPAITTYGNIDVYNTQLRRLGMGYDMRRTLATADPEYYRWTQWIFLQIFNSWYDTAVNRARPIQDLIDELSAGAREPAEGTNPDGRAWSELSGVEQRQVVDNHRLAYRSESLVNWCPGLGTVLANEEVTADGRSERGNFPVFRKPLPQWNLRITAYADRLIDDLDFIDWPEKVRTMQRNWIGRSTGAHIDFPSGTESISVFTTRPDTVFGATYMVLSPEHQLIDKLVPTSWPDGTRQSWTGSHASPALAVAAYRSFAGAKSEQDRQAEGRAKTGVFTGAFATNPVTGTQIPVFIADYVLMGYGTGAIMAVPGQDDRDWEFAELFDLPIVRTVQPTDGFDGKAFTGEGPAINSSVDGLSLDGMGVTEAKATIVDWLESNDAGRGSTTYRLRDWLFSRQRYWGEPFPIVYDETGLPIAVPDSMLPVELPETDDFSPKSYPPDDVDSEPEPPLGRLIDWVSVELDLGDGPRTYRRETNTMPNWAGSCWYELRYLDPHNEEHFVDPAIEHYWMGPDAERPLGGVELYVGGVEHAVLHLLYARFWHKVLHDLGYLSSSEPFHRLVNQGMLQLPAYANEDGFYVEASEVVERDGQFFFGDIQVSQEFGKIGKSLKNVVTPDDYITKFGADTFRLFEMFSGPLEQSRPWDAKAIVGPYRLLQRIWRTVVDEETGVVHVSDGEVPDELNRLLHKTIAAVRDGMESLRCNTSIARITELNNAITQAYPDGGAPRALAEPLVLMLSPLAPHAAEELWSRLGHESSLAWVNFPVADEALLVDAAIEVPVQVNGKVRAVITVAAESDAATLEAAAREDAKVVAALAGRETRRVIAVPGRLVNFVV
ncbi:MAG: leucine--tRNA ligase [Pseudonocardiales bacterium]|nr:MAG: leucine--tRNA ligase [Pseudonocardiales bacterium]